MGLIWVVTNTGGMTMDRWPVFDGASCCPGGGLLCGALLALPVVQQIDKRQVCCASEIQRNIFKYSSLEKNHVPLVSEITLHKRL